jgi:hypothetical protein
MSRMVRYGGQLFPRGLFEPPLNPPRGACVHCGGLGHVPEQIDEDLPDEMVPCSWCQIYCRKCKRWVTKKDHVCQQS